MRGHPPKLIGVVESLEALNGCLHFVVFDDLDLIWFPNNCGSNKKTDLVSECFLGSDVSAGSFETCVL
jgi:hypothetical protein